MSAIADRLSGLKVRIMHPDIEALRHFYGTVLGLSVAGEWQETLKDGTQDDGVIYRIGPGEMPGGGHAFIELCRGEAAPMAGVSLQFPVPAVADIAAALDRAGWPCQGPVQRPWGAIYLYTDDPAGVPIIFFEGGL